MNDTIELPSTRTASFEVGESGVPRGYVHNTEKTPVDPNLWKDQPESVRKELLWIAQHKADQNWSQKELARKVGYSDGAWSRILRDEYTGGNYAEVAKAIANFRKNFLSENAVGDTRIVENRFTKRTKRVLMTAFKVGGMAMISGKSGSGKSETARAFAQEHAHKCTYMVAKKYGGLKLFLWDLATKCGRTKCQTVRDLEREIFKSFNPGRMLIIDDAEFLAPTSGSGESMKMAFLRTFQEATGAVVVLVAQSAFHQHLRNAHAMLEQYRGRIKPMATLPMDFNTEEVAAVAAQYVKRLSATSTAIALEYANRDTGLRGLVEVMKWGCESFASGAKMTNEEFAKAVRGFNKIEGMERED